VVAKGRHLTPPGSLASYPTAQKWLAQFRVDDRSAAASMLNAMLLLNEEQVAAALRDQLFKLSENRPSKRRRLALYAEREFGGAPPFTTALAKDANGRVRRRAVGQKGPAPVTPLRGNTRVGSEGPIAFIISQVCESAPRSFMNHPGPDRIRAKTNPAGSIVIVTDFIGTGKRIRAVLDSFWTVPSVRSWVSSKLLNFEIVAAAATINGIGAVKRHRSRPQVHFEHVAPIVHSHYSPYPNRWSTLIDSYGPAKGRGADRHGFGAGAALIAFNYRIPNNTPALIHQSGGGWKALYEGAAPPDLRAAFGLKPVEELIARVAEAEDVALGHDLPVSEAALVLLLSLIRGRFRAGAEIELAERTGMAVPDVIAAIARAEMTQLLNTDGHLTELGQRFSDDAGRSERPHRPLVPTNQVPYYPMALRTPRASFRNRRPLRRP
jgi:hypothetical protein